MRVERANSLLGHYEWPVTRKGDSVTWSSGKCNSHKKKVKMKSPGAIECCQASAAKLLQSCPTLCDPYRRQPTRLPRPWDSLGKNTGVGCHFLLQCMKVKSESEVAQSCPTFREPMGYSLPGSSVHGIFQVRVLEWGAIAFSNRVLPRV